MTARATTGKAPKQEGERSAGPREAAFFDLDKTLLPGAALFPLAREMYRQGASTTGDILRIASDQIAYRLSGKEDKERIRRAREVTLGAVKGQAQSEVVEMGRAVAERELIPRFYPQAVELMNRHKRAGREVYISSSSPEDFLAILSTELGMDGVIGTRAQVENGVYTGHLDGELCNREEKARRVAELADERVIDLRVARRRTLVGSAVGGVAAAAGAAGYAMGYAVGRAPQRRQHRWARRVAVTLPPHRS